MKKRKEEGRRGRREEEGEVVGGEERKNQKKGRHEFDQFRLSFSTIMDINVGSEIQKLSKREGGEWKRENDKQLYCFFPF